MVNVKETDIGTEPVDFHEVDVELDDDNIEQAFKSDSNSKFVAVLVATIFREGRLTLKGFTNENISKYAAVKLYLGNLAAEAMHFTVRLASKGKSVVRLTVAFFKRNVKKARKDFKCKACKTVCRFAVSAILSHFAIPYLATATATSHLTLASPGSGEACKNF